MKKLKITICLIALLNATVLCQGITISSGTTLMGGSATITLPGNWSNSGTFTVGTATLIFNGTSGNQTIANTNTETFNNITINKAANNVQLSNNITINGTLTITSGNLDLNSKSLSLGSSATVSESSGNGIMGGATSMTLTLNTPSSNNVGGLGAEITSSSNLGSTTVTRGSAVQTSNSNNSIKRYFDITPTTNTGLNATLVFHYDDSELNGITESTLQLFRSADAGSTWTTEGGTVNTTNNTVTLSGINAFSRWTLAGSSSPLPVELTSFEATVSEDKVLLSWETATELNNYGFEIERKIPDQARNDNNVWTKIGFVAGAGNSNSPKSYSFKDKPTGGVTFSYRLKQIDVDGKFEYSDVLTISLSVPERAQLLQNSPNPFNPSTSIKFFIPNTSDVTIRIYDIRGREVATLIQEQSSAGFHIVFWNGRNSRGILASSGVYFYRLLAISEVGNFTETKKMILLK